MRHAFWLNRSSNPVYPPGYSHRWHNSGMSTKITSYSSKVTANQAEKVRNYLEARGFSFSQPQYTQFSAKSRELVVSVYQSGKLLAQGKGTSEFVEFFLEPEVLGEARLGYELDLDPEQLKPHIGVDESGKGDFFGPLVISATYLDSDAVKVLHKAGVQDSKNIKSAKKVEELAELIRKTEGCVVDVVSIGNEAYNRLYGKFRNLNRLLAWGHARTIENVMEKIPPRLPEPEFILSDQFARSKSTVADAMFGKSKSVKLIQRTKAESDVAVAAASIIARDKFVRDLAKMGEKLGVLLPKGASGAVSAKARDIIRSSGEEALAAVCKQHFKTFNEAVAAAGK